MTSFAARRPVQLALWAIVFFLLELPAVSCGPDWPTAVFVRQHGPDAPYARFAAGHLGVPQVQYRPRHLVILYNYLSGRPLTPTEQQAAVVADRYYTDSWADVQKEQTGTSGFQAWIAARASFGPVDGYTPAPNLPTEHTVGPYNTAPNCLDDAFTTAARTLSTRLATYRHSPEVVEWVRGQDAVFINCASAAHAPHELPASAPLWLRQDRAYQLAATAFYLHHNPDALAAFRQIAADSASPWSPLARYLVARTIIRAALDGEGIYDFNATDTQRQQAADTYSDTLKQAREELLAMRSEPRMQPLAHAIDSALDLINARLDPATQQRVLAARLTRTDAGFAQHVIDLTFIHSNDEASIAPYFRPPAPSPAPSGRSTTTDAGDDLLAFIAAFDKQDEAASLAHWQHGHTLPWLVAALTFAKPTDGAVPELLQAAEAVPRTSPAWIAVTYHRLRLMPASQAASMRVQLLDALPTITAEDSISAANLFADLNAHTAPTFAEWIAHASLIPAAQAFDGNETGFDPKAQDLPCSKPRLPAQVALFDHAAATILNTRLPLRLLIQAAQSRTLPPHLRFLVAQSAWTRAVLLNRPADAHALSPLLIGCYPAWKPVLDDYDHAKTTNDREAAGLLALMRFASTDPTVPEGDLRPEGFAHYSVFRDNWWQRTVPERSNNAYIPSQRGESQPVPDPVFLSVAERTEGETEYNALAQIPDAPTYFFLRATDWQHRFPHDARTPELLGQAFRVVRNGSWLSPRSFPGAPARPKVQYEEVLFNLLHREYPNSPWARRYTTWSKNIDTPN